MGGSHCTPAWDYFWHDISVDELRELRDLAMASRVSGEDALMDARAEDTLVKLGVEFRKVEGGASLSGTRSHSSTPWASGSLEVRWRSSGGRSRERTLLSA